MFAAGAFLSAGFFRPRFIRAHRAVDAGIVGCLTLAAIQLIPLPPVLRLTLSPASAAIDRALLIAPSAAPAAQWHALTLDSESTAWALLLAMSVAVTFWSARAMFEHGGALRLTVRGIVWLGLGLAVVTFVQRFASPQLFYGIWKPVARTNTPAPLGPFLNRNDLATWLALAVPLTAGYITAKATSATRAGAGTSVEDILDSRLAVALASVCLMTALLLASASRSGIVGCGIGALALLVMSRRRLRAPQFIGLLAGLAAVAALATAYVNMPMLTARFRDVFAPDLGRGRLEIWRQTWPLAADFWQTGVGLGAFQRGMIVYEKRPFELFINQAHNQYLQLLVEGGVPLAALAAYAVAAGAREAWRRTSSDRTGIGWIRSGAVAASMAVAVQSIWETGLRMPANAALFAVIAAIALHGGAAES